MPYTLTDKLVVGVSSRALFDLEEENLIFQKQGLAAYEAYQVAHENDLLRPGTAFPLIKALHGLNKEGQQLTEIIVMSKNSANTSLRIFNSIKEYGLDISRAALVSGQSISPYLNAFKTDLFLSADEKDVQEAINAGIAAGIICLGAGLPYSNDLSTPVAAAPGTTTSAAAAPGTTTPTAAAPGTTTPAASTPGIDQIRIAFDGDAVIFSDEAEAIYQQGGLEAFAAHEEANARNPLPEGPFAKLLRTISAVQESFPADKVPIRTALVTARNAPAHERVIRTLRAWNVRIDEAFFLGGVPKSEVLKAFGAHIFFDDQAVHTDPASKLVPSARVPYKELP